MGHLIGPSGIGKDQLHDLVEAIMRSFRDHDKAEYKKLEDWVRHQLPPGCKDFSEYYLRRLRSEG